MAYKLLLADDSVTIQRVIELTFSGEDIDVLAVNDGEQAIARIPLERPDIVLADIGMPKRTGYDVATFVKRDPALKHIPVLLLAGAFEPVDDAMAAEAGCDGVLVKPFEPQQVIARVKELLDGAKGIPTRANSTLARPVERLALRPEERHAGPPTRTDQQPLPVSARLTPAPTPAPALPAAVEIPTFEPDDLDGYDFSLTPISQESGAEATKAGGDSLEDYFDRLDAAFATLTSAGLMPASPPSPPAPGSNLAAFDDPLDLPTLNDLLGDRGRTPAPSSPAPSSHLSSPHVSSPHALTPPASSHSIVADAFSALLAVEQGEVASSPVRLTPSPAEPAITEQFIQEVVRRVIDRLSPEVVRTAVTDVVSNVAERLVKEEIERIRKHQ